MLTRELLQQRIGKLAEKIELFARRKSTSAADFVWSTRALATLTLLEQQSGELDTEDTVRATIAQRTVQRIGRPGGPKSVSIAIGSLLDGRPLSVTESQTGDGSRGAHQRIRR